MANILIVDDTRLNAELLEAYLDGQGHHIRVATHGAEALRLAQEDPPELVLLDIMMPKLSGFEVCEQLRSNPATANVGILMITALDQSTDLERAIECGTDDFITRPIHKMELLIRVEALLESLGEGDPTKRVLAYYRRILTGASA